MAIGNLFNREERELAIDKAFFEAEQAEMEREIRAEAAKAEEFDPEAVSFNADPSHQSDRDEEFDPEAVSFNADPSHQNENYKADEVATKVRASAEKESEDSLGGKPEKEPRRTFGGSSEAMGGNEAEGPLGTSWGRRGRQMKQGIGRIWYGLSGQDEKQADVTAVQGSQDLRGKAVRAGLVKPGEVRDAETADKLLANAIQYLDPTLTTRDRTKLGSGLSIPTSATETKRKEDMARKVIAEARRGGDDSLADAWKYLTEDLRSSALKAQGSEYDEVSPAERAQRMDVDSDTEGIQKPQRLIDAGKAREAREAEVFNPDDFSFNTPTSRIKVLGEKKPGEVDPIKLSAEVADSIIHIESRGKADAKNPHSSATGLYQFIDSTWLDSLDKYRPDLKEGRSRKEILDLRLDPEISREIGLRFTEGNIKGMQKAGIKVTRGKVYLAHFLGLGGAKKLLSADPKARVDTVMSRAAMDSNNSLLVKNGEPITIQQFIDWAEKKMT